MVLGTFSPARAWRLAVGPASTRTLGVAKTTLFQSPPMKTFHFISISISFVAFCLLTPGAAHADTLYLCKPYTGSQNFWSKWPCSQQRATTEGFYQVPANPSIAIQAIHAENQRQEARKQQPALDAAAIYGEPVLGSEVECERQREQIKELERLRRQVNPPASQEAIANEIRIRKDRVSALRCRHS